MTAGSAERVDGRNARRDRNTEAVLDAAHALFVEGNLTPSVEDVAQRSGVSLRSVYRYFEDTDALMRAAIARRVVMLGDLFQLPSIGEGDLDERMARFVEHRLRLYDRLAPSVRAALLRAPSAPPIAEQVASRRRQLRTQTGQHFRRELDTFDEATAASRLACIDALFQFEAMEHLRGRLRQSRARAQATLLGGLQALLR